MEWMKIVQGMGVISLLCTGMVGLSALKRALKRYCRVPADCQEEC